MAKKITDLEMHILNESKRFRDGETRQLESKLCVRWAMSKRNVQELRRSEVINGYKWGRTIGYHPRDILTVEAQCMGLVRADDIRRYIESEMMDLLRTKPLLTDNDVATRCGWDALTPRQMKYRLEWARQNGLKAIKFSQKLYRYRECDFLTFDFKIKNQHAA